MILVGPFQLRVFYDSVKPPSPISSMGQPSETRKKPVPEAEEILPLKSKHRRELRQWRKTSPVLLARKAGGKKRCNNGGQDTVQTCCCDTGKQVNLCSSTGS